MNDDQDDQGQTRYEATFDMAAVRDVSKFSDRLHDLMSDYDPQKAGSGLSSQRVRLCLDVPAEWLMLALWMHERQRCRKEGMDIAFQHTIPDKLGSRDIRKAKRHLWRQLHEQYHDDLHWLAIGGHPILRPKQLELPASLSPDLDGEIPF